MSEQLPLPPLPEIQCYGQLNFPEHTDPCESEHYTVPLVTLDSAKAFIAARDAQWQEIMRRERAQGYREGLEAAAKVCEEFDACSPQYMARAIRAMPRARGE